METACQKCQSKRIADISAKCSDMFCASVGGKDYDGYVPKDMGFADKYGDYVAFKYCLDCGQIQGKFPLKETKLEKGEKEES